MSPHQKENQMKKVRFIWPEGHCGAVTSTWDDGTSHDRRLVGIFNQHGLKGSFYLNSGGLGRSAQETGWKDYVHADEVKSLYERHEVGSHTVSHPHVWRISQQALNWEFTEDRHCLEALVGYPIRGAVIPFGWTSGRNSLNETLRVLGFQFARNTDPFGGFELPSDFLSWRPTAHCSVDLLALWQRFSSGIANASGSLLNIWGHSYEFEDGGRWDHIEAFAAAAGADARVWHATAGQIYDYVSAWRNMSWSVDGRLVYNPSALTMFIECDRVIIPVAPGTTQDIGR